MSKEKVAKAVARNKKNLLTELKAAGGHVARACGRAGVHRTTYYEYRWNDRDFAEKTKEIRSAAREQSREPIAA